MSHNITWSEHAVDTAAGFLTDDAPGLQQLLAAVDHLAEDPHPVESVAYGSVGLHRLKVGRYRVLYELDQSEQSITICRPRQAR